MYKRELFVTLKKGVHKMNKKKLLSGMLAAAMLMSTVILPPQTVSAAAEPTEIVLDKSTLGNPIAGFNENGEITYAGDPNILVDGDTVYLYVGHDDTGSGGGYTMPDYLCYSTQDLKEWKYEGVVMDMADVAWSDNGSAWAAQVTKHNGKYYMLYCAENKGSYGKEVGVAVADSPTGPFVPQDEPYFHEMVTNTSTCEVKNPDTGEITTAGALYGRKASFGWEDIDPTLWYDTDENGEEHIYMMWGNSNLWMCELTDDMLSIKDQNGDGKITQGVNADIWYQNISGIEKIDGVDYTEAPWLYRRQDADGNYYGDFYVFFASHWREEMAYATCSPDTFGNDSKWVYGGGKEGYGHLMEPTATSNTNHPAVFDFEGKTYFIYHNGSLPGGSGYRRVICIEEMQFNEDGSIEYIQETSTGISGTANQILDSTSTPLAHTKFNNSIGDPDKEYNYPKVNVAVTASENAAKADALWEIEEGKSDKNEDTYVSIESYNKPGMYLKATGAGKKVVLSRDHNNDTKSDANGITADSKNMTFRTLSGYNGTGVTFESVAYPGNYMAVEDGKLVLVDYYDSDECVFEIASKENVASIAAQKTTRAYKAGSALSTNDIRLKVTYEDGTTQWKTDGFTTNASAIDMTTAGTKTLTISYTDKGVTKTYDVPVTVYTTEQKIETPVQADIVITGEEAAMEDLPEAGDTATAGGVKYKVTKVDESNADGTNGTVSVTGITSKKAKKVIIPDEVEINGYSFAVNKIESKAFYNCKKLKTITIGDNVKSIGKNAFKGIHRKATFKVSSDAYTKVKKALKSNTGFAKKTMKIKEI